ncbi:MAG: hypothetical protein H7Y08_08810 [Rhizobiaceae bacterium]|nr:hypothetical protein [Rhizobiaceae bacterium]
MDLPPPLPPGFGLDPTILMGGDETARLVDGAERRPDGSPDTGKADQAAPIGDIHRRDTTSRYPVWLTPQRPSGAEGAAAEEAPPGIYSKPLQSAVVTAALLGVALAALGYFVEFR